MSMSASNLLEGDAGLSQKAERQGYWELTDIEAVEV